MAVARVLITPEEAFAALGVQRAKGYSMLRTGELVSIKVGRLRRIPVEALQRFVEERLDAQHGGRGA